MYFYLSKTWPLISPSVSLDLTNLEIKKMHSREHSHSILQRRKESVKRKT